MAAQLSKSVDPDMGARVRFTAGGVWRGAVEIAPIAVFVIPFGLAFGAASTKAVPSGIAVLMSGAIFAGASQFTALDLWYAPLPLAMLALTVLAVNARHILLGAALAPWLLADRRGTSWVCQKRSFAVFDAYRALGGTALELH